MITLKYTRSEQQQTTIQKIMFSPEGIYMCCSRLNNNLAYVYFIQDDRDIPVPPNFRVFDCSPTFDASFANREELGISIHHGRQCFIISADGTYVFTFNEIDMFSFIPQKQQLISFLNK